MIRNNSIDLDKIPAYLKILIAMSIRDSSFVISFSTTASKAFQKTVQNGSENYYYRIDLIDVDIKPLEKLEKYISEIKLHG